MCIRDRAKPFEKEQELAEKTARLAELNAMLNMDENGETGQPEHAGGQEDPEIHQQGSTETDRKAEDAAGRQADGIKQGMPENRGLYQETEKPSLGVAESVGYEPIQRKADMEMHRPAGHEQEKTEALKQPSGQLDTQEQMQVSANAAGKQGKTPSSADGKETPGYMQVRTSVREKLAAIRERRAAEQAQNRAQKPQIKKDRAAVL